jgi:hypothetical protein
MTAPASTAPLFDRAKAWARPSRLLSAALDAATLAVSASVFVVYNDVFMHNAMEYDEGFFVWCGWCILKGMVPYRDFIEFKPPVLFLTHALALKIGGFPNFGYRRVFSAFSLFAVLFCQLTLLRRGVDRLLALALTVGFLWIFVNPAVHDTALTDSESVGLAYFLVGFGFLMFESKYRAWTDVAGGAFMACSVLSKEPYAPAVVATWTAVFLFRDGLDDLKARAWRYLKLTTIGVAIVILGLVVYMAPTGALKAYFQMLPMYPRIHRDPTHSICVLLGRVFPSTPMHNLSYAWDGLCKNFFTDTIVGMMLPLFAAAFAFIARRSRALLAVGCLALIGALWSATASNCQWPHYYSMPLSGFYAFIAIGLCAMQGPFAAMDGGTRAFIRLALVGAVAFTAWPRYKSERAEVHISHPNSEPLPGIFDFVAEHSAPQDRIVTTGPPHLYVETNRLSAIRESNLLDELLYAYDGDTDEERLRPIHDELVKHMPKIVVLDPERSDRKVRTIKALFMPFLAQFHYRKERENVYVRD